MSDKISRQQVEEKPFVIESVLGRLAAGDNLSQEEMAAVIDQIMQGNCAAGQIGLLLTLLREKGETCAEIAGAASAMRQHMVTIRTQRTGFLDTCGTGGDGSGTFNISTAAAIVTAAAGVPVAKHGNRKISSRTGSADVLAELGVNVAATPEQVERCIDTLGICFCFAPLLHPAMKQVAEVRRELGVPTIFNLLGPLSNPAGAPFQLLGVGRPELRPLLAEALALLGTERAVVVCGEDGLDEVTLAADTQVTLVEQGSLEELHWTPEMFGLERQSLSTLTVDGPPESAAMIRAVLAGDPGPARDIVLLNVAAALFTAGKATDLKLCMQQASVAIDSGAAAKLLAELAELSHAEVEA